MAKKKQKKKKKMPEQVQRPKDFLDMIAPAAVKFNTDHFILGSRYHTAMTLKSYPPMTDELALLRGLGDMGGVNLRLTARQVTPAEEDAILHAATNKSRMERSNTNDYKQSVTAEANLRDMAELLAKQRQEKEPLIHCGVYLDIAAADTEKLRTARDTVSAQLVRSRMGADPLLLRQREGFLSANPAGGSQLANFAERVLPARSVANLYPMNYSGKTDPKGFFIGRDRFGSNIIVDFDRRASDKTNASALILGNTGQGKSYLLKLLLCNVREAAATWPQTAMRSSNSRTISRSIPSSFSLHSFRSGVFILYLPQHFYDFLSCVGSGVLSLVRLQLLYIKRLSIINRHMGRTDKRKMAFKEHPWKTMFFIQVPLSIITSLLTIMLLT